MLNLHFKSPSFFTHLCMFSLPFSVSQYSLTHSGIVVMHANDLKVLCVVPMKIPDQLKKNSARLFPCIKECLCRASMQYGTLKNLKLSLGFLMIATCQLSYLDIPMSYLATDKSNCQKIEFLQLRRETGVVCFVCFSYQHFFCKLHFTLLLCCCAAHFQYS